MKAGIMTFHASYNCGSILQALALQSTLMRWQLDAPIIDYSNAGQQAVYATFYPVNSVKNLVRDILCAPGYRRIKNHYRDYQAYIDAHLHVTEKRYSCIEELTDIDIAEGYDCLVCGSDQIWNILCDDHDDAYFLSFAKTCKKIAYAPSMGGVNILEQARDIGHYRHLLTGFAALSVREQNGRKWLEQLTNRPVKVALDPSLLLTKAEWDDRVEPYGEIPAVPYIFYYAFAYSPEVNRAVRDIARYLRMPVVVIDAKQWCIRSLWYYGFHIPKRGGPNAFLNLIRNAALVMTTSFHGTAFSAIFQKPFWFINSAMHTKEDDRAESLLAQLGLMDRYIRIPELTRAKVLDPIEYTTVEETIANLRRDSLEFLHTAVFQSEGNE